MDLVGSPSPARALALVAFDRRSVGRLLTLRAAIAVVLLLGSASMSHGQSIRLDFDALPGMANLPGNAVPVASQLSDQFLDTLGVSFSSNGGFAAVAVHGEVTTSHPNVVGGVSGGNLSYLAPVTISFFDPANPADPRVTDFVSIRGDPFPFAGETATMEAFDLLGQSLGSVSAPDVSGGLTLSMSVPGIHSVVITQDSFGTIGLDDLQFNPVGTSGPSILVVQVEYSTGSVVTPPLSFGLGGIFPLPESFRATIVLPGFRSKKNIVAGLGDVGAFWLGFGDGQWTELTSFALVTDETGEVTTLSYATTQIDTPTAVAGPILNSSFSATIEGTDIGTGQDFEYSYANSVQTLVVIQGKALPAASAWGLGTLALLMLGCAKFILRKGAGTERVRHSAQLGRRSRTTV